MHLLHLLQMFFLQILRCDAPITSISNAFLQILRCDAPLKSDTNVFQKILRCYAPVISITIVFSTNITVLCTFEIRYKRFLYKYYGTTHLSHLLQTIFLQIFRYDAPVTSITDAFSLLLISAIIRDCKCYL
jgi:hypothetical protein